MAVDYTFTIKGFEFVFTYSEDERSCGIRIKNSQDIFQDGFQAALQSAAKEYDEYFSVMKCDDRLFEMACHPDGYSQEALTDMVDLASRVIAEVGFLSDQKVARYKEAIGRITSHNHDEKRWRVTDDIPPKPFIPKPGYVYLIQSLDGYFKIGMSKKPNRRIKKLGVELPFPIHPIHFIKTDHMSYAETDLHHKYKNERIRGEWFSLTDEQVQNICSIKDMIYGGAE